MDRTMVEGRSESATASSTNYPDEVHLALRFSDFETPKLIRTSFFMPGLHDHQMKQLATPLVAREGDIRWIKGSRSLCVLLLDSLIRESAPETILDTLSARKTTYDYLRQTDRGDGSKWLKAIFGYQSDGHSSLSCVFRNGGSESNPRPTLDLDTSTIRVWWLDQEITKHPSRLANLAEAIVIQNKNADRDQEKPEFHQAYLRITNDADRRIMDYKACLSAAAGDIFISGTSMISLSEDSFDLLRGKLRAGSSLRLLILCPEWAKEQSEILTFLPEGSRRQSFHLEIRNSIAKLAQLHDELPGDARSRMQLKAYRTIFPYTITGYRHEGQGRCVVEINDHLPERHRPRFILDEDINTEFFDLVLGKFDSLWSAGGDLVEDLIAS